MPVKTLSPRIVGGSNGLSLQESTTPKEKGGHQEGSSEGLATSSVERTPNPISHSSSHQPSGNSMRSAYGVGEG